MPKIEGSHSEPKGKTMSVNSKWTHVALPITIMVVLLMATLLPGSAGAGSKLWLYPDSEDPRNGGHVVDTGDFVLNIDNLGSGNGDTTTYEVFVVLSVNDPAFLIGGSLGLPDGTSVDLDPASFVFDAPVFPCSGHSFPPHGVYPSFMAEFFIGDIADGEVVQIAVDLQGDDALTAHFDAFGTGYKQAGPNLKCYDVSNPSGHGVSVVLGDGDDPCPWLVIDKVASASGVDFGDQVDFTITVENLSECDATGVVVSETIPTVVTEDGSVVPAFTVVAVDPSPTEQTDGMLIWDIGDLEAGESLVFTVTVVFDEPAADGTVVENTACVFFTEIDDVICSSAVVAVGAVADGEIGGRVSGVIRFALPLRDGTTPSSLSKSWMSGWPPSMRFPPSFPSSGIPRRWRAHVICSVVPMMRRRSPIGWRATCSRCTSTLLPKGSIQGSASAPSVRGRSPCRPMRIPR